MQLLLLSCSKDMHGVINLSFKRVKKAIFALANFLQRIEIQILLMCSAQLQYQLKNSDSIGVIFQIFKQNYIIQKMQSKNLTNIRQLEIDTEFLQISPSSNLKQYYNQNLNLQFKYSSENFILDNQQKSSKITNPSRKSISMFSTAVLTIQNSLRTLILKRMFSAWTKIRGKSMERQDDLSGQNFEGFSIQYQNQLNQPRSQPKQYNPNLTINPDTYEQNTGNVAQIGNQSVSADSLRLCFNSPKLFETTIRDPNQILKSYSSKMQTNLSTERQHEARLNFHVTQLKEISKAYSIKSKSNSQRSRKYQSLSQSSQDALSQSRALILREIAQKLKKYNSRNSHSVILDNFNAKKSQQHSNQQAVSQESRYIRISPKPEKQLDLNLNAIQTKINGKLKKLQLMMSNIKREHQKIQGGPIVQKKKIKIDRSRQQYFQQLQGVNQRKNRFQEESERYYYLKQLQKLKHQLNEVKIANNNIWNYAKNMETLRERQHYNQKRILQQAIQNQRRKTKSVSDQLENIYRERSQKGFLNNFKQQRQFQKPVSYVRLHVGPSATSIRPSSQPSTNIVHSYNIPRYSQAHSRQVPLFYVANDTINTSSSRRKSYNGIINSRVTVRPGSVPIFFNKKVFQADSLRQSMHIASIPIRLSQQKKTFNRSNRCPTFERIIQKKINPFYNNLSTNNVKKGNPNLVRTSNTSLRNEKLSSDMQRTDMKFAKNIVFQNLQVQNKSSNNIVRGHTLTKEGSEMLCTFWPFSQKSRKQI